jgi:hypothetical protein
MPPPSMLSSFPTSVEGLHAHFRRHGVQLPADRERRPGRSTTAAPGHPRPVQDRLLQRRELTPERHPGRHGDRTSGDQLEITLVGNKDLKTEELTKGLKDIGLVRGRNLRPPRARPVTQELTRQYNNRGKYNVSITPTVTPLDRNRVDLKMEVKRRQGRASIKHVNIVGNESLQRRGDPRRLGIGNHELAVLVQPW